MRLTRPGPAGYYTDEAEFLKRVEEDAISFRPPGTCIHTYSRPTRPSSSKGKEKVVEEGDTIDFEVYHVRPVVPSITQRLSAHGAIFQCTWDTLGFKELHRRMQLFILLYIEGGSYIKEEEDVWQFVIL